MDRGGSERTAQLAQALAQAVDGEVRFDSGSRALYATDGSNYRQVPMGVVVPRTIDAAVAAVSVCRQWGVPILSRGCGTSLAGQSCNVAVVIDFSKHVGGILWIDPAARRARVLPGTILDSLCQAARAHGLTFGPDPATHAYCTLGGMIGNDSCGPHALMAGRTSDNVHELEVLTYDGLRLRVGATPEQELEAIIAAGGRRGEIYRRMRELRDRYAPLIRQRFPGIPRRVSGYSLDELLPERGFHVARALVGSEGTLVTVLEATVRLVPAPAQRALLVVGYPDVFSAADHVPELLAEQPIALEGLDDKLLSGMRRKHLDDRYLSLLPAGGGFLIAEFAGANREEAVGRARRAADAVTRRAASVHSCVFDNPADQEHIWKIREAGLGATAWVPGERDTWEGWEDSAVPVAKLGEYLRELRGLYRRFGYTAALYGHFGQGCVHTRIPFDLRTEPGIRTFREFMDRATDLVVRLGGSLSGEHGDGQSRAEFLRKMFGDELIQAFRELKAIWDPAGRMNPGKVVDAYRIDQNLRLGPAFRPPQLRTAFSFPDDGGNFARAALRCIGVGKCRRLEGETMCPSFKVLREEKHSTRGRAHLLFEMTRGTELRGWRDDHVREALDLCLSCKGCKGECPVNVDVATYKAEFLAHHFAGRLRPRAAYALGLIDRWAQAARLAPGLANGLAHAPGVARLLKAAAGIAAERDIPRFAARTFQDQFRSRPWRKGDAGAVILWPDTFTNHFHPDNGLAAAEVLEAMGHEVIVPRGHLCCGRPLYDWGMLGRARRYLRRVLDALREPLRAEIPVIGLEPSCVSVFRDELPNLLPDDDDARRLASQARLFPEWIARRTNGRALPKLSGRVLVHGHCHQKALAGMDDEVNAVARLGLDVEVIDSGCCGMAGGFGYEAGQKHALSIQIGELKLLPEVRRAPPDVPIVADGFSCREQIRQQTDRRAVHVAELMARALHPRGEQRLDTGSILSARPGTASEPAHISWVALLALAGVSVAGGWLTYSRTRRRRR